MKNKLFVLYFCVFIGLAAQNKLEDHFPLVKEFEYNFSDDVISFDYTLDSYLVSLSEKGHFDAVVMDGEVLGLSSKGSLDYSRLYLNDGQYIYSYNTKNGLKANMNGEIIGPFDSSFWFGSQIAAFGEDLFYAVRDGETIHVFKNAKLESTVEFEPSSFFSFGFIPDHEKFYIRNRMKDGYSLYVNGDYSSIYESVSLPYSIDQDIYYLAKSRGVVSVFKNDEEEAQYINADYIEYADDNFWCITDFSQDKVTLICSNGKTYGPYDEIIGKPLIQANDSFVFAYRNGDDSYVFDSGKIYGPYSDVTCATAKRGNESWYFSYHESDGYYVVMDGKTAGPFIFRPSVVFNQNTNDVFIEVADKQSYFSVYDFSGREYVTFESDLNIKNITLCFTADGSPVVVTTLKNGGLVYRTSAGYEGRIETPETGRQTWFAKYPIIWFAFSSNNGDDFFVIDGNLVGPFKDYKIKKIDGSSYIAVLKERAIQIFQID